MAKSWLGFVCLQLAISFVKGSSWTPGAYPNPADRDQGFRLCRRPGRSFVCDPDSLISRDSANVVEGVIKDIRHAVDPYRADGCSNHATEFPGFQVAVALMEKIQRGNASPHEAAHNFAVQLFNDWGVGDKECQNGVLLLLSKLDKQVYIYAGKRALEVAPQHRLKVIVDRMRPLLRQGDYNRALEEGIVNLGLILSGGEPGGQPGEPRQKGEGSYWGLGVFLAIFAGVMGLTGWKSWLERHQGQEQRKCIELLEKLKREQRHALATGQYPAASCPICFEDFDDSEVSGPSAPPLPEQSKRGDNSSDVSAPLLNPLKQHIDAK